MWAGGGHRASPHLPRAIWQLLPWAAWPHSTRALVVGAEQTESHFTGGPGGSASQRSWAQVCAELLCVITHVTRTNTGVCRTLSTCGVRNTKPGFWAPTDIICGSGSRKQRSNSTLSKPASARGKAAGWPPFWGFYITWERGLKITGYAATSGAQKSTTQLKVAPMAQCSVLVAFRESCWVMQEAEDLVSQYQQLAVVLPHSLPPAPHHVDQKRVWDELQGDTAPPCSRYRSRLH